ncbi:hypothetical protein [Deinococcus maricopensis]|uniref:Uncharacterized protein n=1 Tax=Deinococcus maricopensis (strain DSM 21211 / LMG 22137 / NRRL B-23946 / LB-34) TaxID=709986 RepID=E8UB83_DEIML|nr:hypothetical protein [Deinococcus maricopensis]ADV68322.1 hypothetical protein Deima_2691 [Deinococcus maricopensis DSM 21211]
MTPSRPASALPRPLDLTLPSNRFALLGAGAAVLAARTLGRPWGHALRAGAGAFCAWAIARELDPDHPGSAGAALTLALASGVRQPPDVLGAFTLLSALRLTVCTVGERVTVADSVAVSAQGALAGAFAPVGAALAPTLALAGSAGARDALSPPAWTAAAALAGAALGRAARRSPQPAGVLAPALLGGVTLAAALLPPEQPACRTDNEQHPVDGGRLRLTRAVAVTCATLDVASGGARRTAPLLAALLAVAARRTASRS